MNGQDVRRWIIWLPGEYCSAYASGQCRGLRQFFRWLAAEEELADPLAGLKPPGVAGNAQRRDAAIVALCTATGIRLPGMAGIRCHP